jgi:uncharacterized membrane protein YphA (DoxX/SURF4 family)
MNRVATALRIFFALLFLTTALGKLLDNRGFAEVLRTYQLFPDKGLLAFALSISLVELLLGVILLLNRKIKICSLSVLGINCGYLLLAVVTNLRGLKLENCGCFGVFLARPMTWETVVEDAVIVFLSVVFWGLEETRVGWGAPLRYDSKQSWL